MSRYVRSAGGQSRTSNLNTQWEYIYSCSNWTESLGSVACFEIPFKNYNAIKTLFIGGLSCQTSNQYCIHGFQCYRYYDVCSCTINFNYIFAGLGLGACYASTEEIIYVPSCQNLVGYCAQQLAAAMSYRCRSFHGYANVPDQCPWNWNCVEFIRVCNSLGEVSPSPDVNASFHVFGQSK